MESNHRTTWTPRNTLQEIKQGMSQYCSLTAPRPPLPIPKIQNSMQWLPLMEIQQLHLSPLQPLNRRRADAWRTNKWDKSPINVYSSLETKTRTALRASGFWEQSYGRCSGAFVSAIAQDDLDTTKQKAPNNILKIDDPPNFQIQVAKGQLEKPLSTATLKFEIGDNSFDEHFVVMKKLTGPIIGLHFMRNNSVVIDTTHGPIHFPHLTMQVKTTSSETTTKPQPVITDEALIIPPTTTKTITAFIDHPSKWNTTGTVTPLEKLTETASLLISHSKSTIINKKNSSQSDQHHGITISH